MKSVSNQLHEIQELLGNVTSASEICRRFSLVKTQSGASIILTNGTEFKLNNGESWYLTPEAVLDLCMFMTGVSNPSHGISLI